MRALKSFTCLSKAAATSGDSFPGGTGGILGAMVQSHSRTIYTDRRYNHGGRTHGRKKPAGMSGKEDAVPLSHSPLLNFYGGLYLHHCQSGRSHFPGIPDSAIQYSTKE